MEEQTNYFSTLIQFYFFWNTQSLSIDFQPITVYKNGEIHSNLKNISSNQLDI